MTQGTLYKPTAKDRKLVEEMAGFGIPHNDIAVMMDVAPKTLRKHFERELQLGSIRATTKVAKTLFHLATVEKNVASVIFWMKARAGWSEKQNVQVDVTGTVNVAKLNDLDLDEAIKRELAAFLVSNNEGEAEKEYTGTLN